MEELATSNFGVFVVGKQFDSVDREDGGSNVLRSVGKYLKMIIMIIIIYASKFV
jgi:hypothetical protein